jgi:hypothetical protein
MRDQEIVGLWEAYSSIYESPDSDVVNENIQNKVSVALNRGAEIVKNIEEKNPVFRGLTSILKPVPRVPGRDRGPVTSTHRDVANRQEQFETWVNDLVEEGYDLSDYTWNDMYEMFMNLDEGDGRAREGSRDRYNETHGRPLLTPQVTQSRSSQGTLGGGTYRSGRQRLPKKDRKWAQQVLRKVRGAGEVGQQRAREILGIRESYDFNRRRRRGEVEDTRESYDFFDYILEHLIAEGYADTNDAALSIMANMSEEWKQSIVEAQHARENPEEYEREQRKKTAPVRGERTPMPPRGDKRREDFEKWYRANVR